MSRALHRYRRKRVTLAERPLEFFPWIGTNEGSYDLFRNKEFSLFNFPGSFAIADQFLWVDPLEDTAPYESFYGSYFSPTTGFLRIERVMLEPRKETLGVTVLKNDVLGLSSYYIGGTCFFDPVAVRVSSAFEDSSNAFWPGETGNIVGLNYSATPVGGNCFAREGEQNSSSTTGSTTPAEKETFFNGTWSDTTAGPFRGFLTSYFQQTTIFNNVRDFCRLPALAGRDLSIYACERFGSITENTERLNANPIFGNQFILQDNAAFGGEIATISGAGQALINASETVEISSFGSGPTFNLTAFAINQNTYSDAVSVISVSPKSFTDITITGALAVGQTINILLNSGGYTGNNYEQSRSFTENTSERFDLTHEIASPGSTFRDLYNTVLSQFPLENVDFITPDIIGMPGVQEDPLDWQEVDTVWRDGSTANGTFNQEIQFTLTSLPNTSISMYDADADYRFKSADLLNNKFILVDRDNSKRFNLKVSSTDFTYLNDITNSPSPVSVTTETINGTTFECTVESEETIFWDSGSGELADMTTPYLLYALNNINSSHIPPEFSQFYGNSKNFELRITGGGSS